MTDLTRPEIGDGLADAEAVARMSDQDRRLRVISLTGMAHEIVDLAIEIHAQGKEIRGVCLLYSGGNDSTLLGHIMRKRATHAIHANTGIGIEGTRDFVRETCRSWGIPLIEKHPPVSYDDLVIERGFPGPAMHWKMYTRLKERCLEAARRDLVDQGRRQRVIFLAGRRGSESARRKQVPPTERKGSVVWASPLALWTALDMTTYRKIHGVPRNPVADLIHMSGECLCGAFAHPGELDEIGFWFPEVRERIEALERKVAAAGHPEPLCRWGHGEGRASKSGPLCTSCDLKSTGGRIVSVAA